MFHEEKQKATPTFCANLNSCFTHFTGYEFKNVNSFDKLTRFLHKPRDGSSLAVARIFFGLLMMIDIVEERSGSELDIRWGDVNECRFQLFSIIAPMSLPRMGILYGIMWFGALGISLGYKFKISCWMYTVPYWYLILVDKSVWNNHTYLFGLMGILFSFSSADSCCSLDSYFKEKGIGASTRTNSQQENEFRTVPFWNYFIIKFQYYILYTYAGLVKLSPEWLSGYSMTYLGNHWVFTPFRLILGTVWTDLLIVHWFGCLFDLTVAFWLTHKRTRFIATFFAIAFHLMNTRLFHIGMFPWVCLAHLPLFYEVDWPRKLISRRRGPDARRNLIKSADGEEKTTGPRQKKTTLLLGLYIFLQLFLPNSHFITKGYNNWTKGLYGYSWNMMVNSWQPIMTTITVVDNKNNKTFYLDPDAFADNHRWTRHADMAKQYAECIQRNIGRIAQEETQSNDKEQLISPENISIYFDIWCSMNSRFQQRVFDPRVDILKAKWSPFVETSWVLPILSELTVLRPELNDLTQRVYQWNNYSDVLFIADYPGLSLNNYVLDSADNVTLAVLRGSVQLSYDKSQGSLDEKPSPVVVLTQGQSAAIEKQRFHNILVTSETPASYMYTYTNLTMSSGGTDEDNTTHKSLLPLWDETRERWNKFEMFFRHVLNSLMYEIYGVPMPLRIRSRSEE